VDKDITLWADDQGRTSWMRRFVDYLRSHGHLRDLSFMSFEHYPFLVNGFSPPDDWDTLYAEPGIMKHVLQMWRDDGVPADVPLIISESGITAGGGQRGYMGVTGNAIWECDAFGTFFAGGGKAFYRPAINDGAGGRRRGATGGRIGGGTFGTAEYTPFTSAHMINFEWLEHGAGENQIFPASADLLDAAGRHVISVYAAHRPDGQWAVMMINHDLNAAHEIHLVMNDGGVQRTFAGEVSLVQYCNTPGENKNVTQAASADGTYTLPIGSITVIRGRLQ